MNDVTHTTHVPSSGRWENFSLFAVCALAFSVSLGAALIGISKLLVLLALLVQIWRDGWPAFKDWWRQAPKTVVAVGVALSWLALTGLWTEAEPVDALKVFIGHGRLFWLLASLYLIRTPERAWKVLTWLALGQALVLLVSWLLWLGVPVPFTKKGYPQEMGIVTTSTLEQPVMTTLLCVLLWHLRERWQAQLGALWGRWLVYAGLALGFANVFLVMTGRTGYLVMLVFLMVSLFMVLPKRWRVGLAFLPPILLAVLFQWSPRFHDRMTQVHDDITQYQNGQVNTSQGLRLDNWRVSLEAIQEKPLLGHGVGSFSKVYAEHHGHEQRVVRDPHQQYLFWFVEGGVVALGLLLAFLIAPVRDAAALSVGAGRALVCTTAIAATMALANCPFFGVGMGEFFLVMMAGLLGTRMRTA